MSVVVGAFLGFPGDCSTGSDVAAPRAPSKARVVSKGNCRTTRLKNVEVIAARSDETPTSTSDLAVTRATFSDVDGARTVLDWLHPGGALYALRSLMPKIGQIQRRECSILVQKLEGSIV